MRRREFITVIGGAAMVWPLAVDAQQPGGVRRIGMLMSLAADDAESPVRLAAFRQALQQLGWNDGDNVRIDVHFGAGNNDQLRKQAAELAALGPDVILATGSPSVAALQQANVNKPIVFVQVIDPVAAGFAANLSKPGGNATGFTQFEYGTSAKWLELLKSIAPGTTHVGVLRDPTITSGIGELAAIQAVASSFRVELRPMGVRSADEIMRAIGDVAQQSNSALIVLPSAPAAVHRELIVTLAARHRLPAVYAYRYYVASGGLISYGPDTIDQYRRAAGYVDRILRGEKPADLPVQQATKFELVINLKTAKALGLTIPPMLLASADEVIE
jgi:putative tryptophan/tyrosine transport system substrate-binding protein